MSSYEAPPELEEMQLLRQVLRWPLRITHSATIEIAARLVAAGDLMLWQRNDGHHVEITAQGRQRVAVRQPGPEACPFCNGELVRHYGSWTHPHYSGCVLQNFATSDIEGWNTRAAVQHG